MDLDEMARFREKLYGLALRILKDPERAQDAVQSAYVKALSSTFNGESQLYTWLYRITVNVCLDLKRGDAKRPKLSDDFETQLALIEDDRTPSQDKLLEMKTSREAMVQAMERIGWKHRLVIQRALAGRLVYSEIAMELGVNETTARGITHRACKAMRKAMRRAA